jgi:putative flippase GtrA
VLMVLAGLVLSTLLVWLFATRIGAVPAKGLAIGATLCLNFLVSRLFVFAVPGRS